MPGRNALCPCGSGKKYKKCCLGKTEIMDQPPSNGIELKNRINKKISEARIKQCIHPNQNECEGKIVNAHSIQNNGILKAVSDNGEVKMFKPKINEGLSLNMTDVGRSKATTFTGFCSYHDKTTFQPIEDKSYQGTEEQKFLFAYRAFAFEYHKKREQVAVLQNCIKEDSKLAKRKGVQTYLNGNLLALKDFDWAKDKFDRAIVDRKYGILNGIELTLPGRARLAVCSSYYLEYDLEGKMVNNVQSESPDRLKMLFINIFPETFCTHVLLNWFKEDEDCYKSFKQQFQSLNIKDQLKVLNNLIPLYSENFVVNPALWESFTPFAKVELDSIFSKLYDVSSDDLVKERQYNLFKEIILVG